MAPQTPNEEQLDVPDNVLTACPLVKFAFVPVAKKCVVCPFFAGLADRFPGGSHRFAVRYSVRCSAEPVQRQVIEMAGDDAGAPA